MQYFRILLLALVFLSASCTAIFRNEHAEWKPSEEPHLLQLRVENAYGQISRMLTAPEFRDLAEDNASTLAGITSDLAAALDLRDPSVRWADVVFVDEEPFIPAVRSGVLKWALPASVVRSNSAEIVRDELYSLITHEQVHHAQMLLYPDTRLPRWFSEGMADWVSLHVLDVRAPDIARSIRNERIQDAGKENSLQLGEWGGLRIKREAMLRQVNDADRARMLADPKFVPPGPFRVGPGDFEEDNVPQDARYRGALAVFDALEAACGAQQLLQALTSISAEKIDNRYLASHFQSRCAFDIGPLLE